MWYGLHEAQQEILYTTARAGDRLWVTVGEQIVSKSMCDTGRLCKNECDCGVTGCDTIKYCVILLDKAAVQLITCHHVRP